MHRVTPRLSSSTAKAYRQIGHDSDDKCECIFAGGKGGCVYTRGSYVKWNGGSGKILRQAPVTMRGELLSDVNGIKRGERDRAPAVERGQRSLFNSFRCIGDGTIN
ncbi:hypothetical protein DBV15_00370 [Temnothorax longispinosus]|uniref:Uncharacterized protein n=1 Tax=Temnothorax longispinosus TaxID=300112 RepID=A0A4S2JQ08_9HYME|nr:hypothetical protein DBV15_00370 [Temnothorax longispinosus]